MPIYEYRCESCAVELEKLQKMSDPVLKDCPECGKSTLIKMISASSFRLKGTGWYETDFKTGDKKNVVTDSNAGTSGSDSSDKESDKGKSTTKESKSNQTSSKGSEKSSGQNKSAATGS